MTAIKQAINKVKHSNRSDKKLIWAFPIASELYKLNCSLMIQWGVKCVQMYLSEFGHPKFNELSKYVQQILDSENNLTSLQCTEIGRTIWDLPERDNIQIAIARLWWVLSACKLGHDRAAIMETNSAITLLLPNLSDLDLFDNYLKAAITIYEKNQLQ
jgi:hypothetical protein